MKMNVVKSKYFKTVRKTVASLRSKEAGRKQRILSIVNAGNTFDRKFYLSEYPDVRDAGIDPLVHFAAHGFDEGRMPADGQTGIQLNNQIREELYRLGLQHASELTPIPTVENKTATGTWITPSSLLVSSKTGCLASLTEIGCGQDSQLSRYLLPETEENALVIPIVAANEQVDFARIAVGQPHASSGAVSYSLGITLSESDGVFYRGSSAVSKGYVTVPLTQNKWPAGVRIYVRLWCENEKDLYLSGVPFHPQHYLARRTVSSSFRDDVVSPSVKPVDETLKIAFFTDFGASGKEHLESVAAMISTGADVEMSGLQRLLDPAKSTELDLVIVALRDGSAWQHQHSTAITKLNDQGTVTAFLDLVSLTKATASRFRELESVGHLKLEYSSGKTVPDGSPTLTVISNLDGSEEVYGNEDAGHEVSFSRLTSMAYPMGRLPHVALISVLYKKAEAITAFLHSLFRQTYAGPLSVVLVDDCSPDDSAERVRRLLAELDTLRPKNISIKLVTNAENLGNCGSRNRGISEVDAQIYTIVDCDCLLNRDYISSHVREHLTPKVDVVIGPLNLETHGKDGLALLEEMENDPRLVETATNMQDDIQLNGFVNCITRNLSIRKDTLDRIGAFDLDFSYSAKPDTGFGWEDVELGYRIYRDRCHIRFTPGAFTLHQSHPASMPEDVQIRGSARNFDKLFTRHPELENVARRWSARTAGRILDWADRKDVASDSLDRLRSRFDGAARSISPFLSTWGEPHKRLRIVSYRWHVPHQYELYKLQHDFTLITGTGTNMTNHWQFDQRPLRSNVRMIPIENFNPKEYDLAILHFDENVLCSDLSNDTLPPDWGESFQWLASVKGLPKIAVCHGTPPFVGQYGADPGEISDFTVHSEEVNRIRTMLEDATVICNSYQAAEEWGFSGRRVIWHGLDPQEIPTGSHGKQVVGHGEDHSRPHYRGLHCYRRVSELLDPGIHLSDHKHAGVKLIPSEDPRYSHAKFRNWIDHVGSFKVYLNTTLRSPMPRSRSEAMMSGVIPVTLNNHDADHFIRHGVNGFLGASADELADAINYLLRNEHAREKISAEARHTATNVFNHDRYLSDWESLLKSLGFYS